MGNLLTKKLALYVLSLLLFLASGSFMLCSAQEATKIMGMVRDAQTGDTLPFVSIYFKDTQVGATTGFDGRFSLESRKASDTLVASYVGYATIYLPIQRNRFQVVDIQMRPEKYELAGVVIHPRENPAEILLRKIIDHKPQNDPDKVETFQCQAYTKMQFDVNNLGDKFKNRRILEPFRFIFEQMDTSVINGKVYLPVMISESFSDLYFRKSPRVKKEIIRASQISGVENTSMSQFVGNMVQDVKVYDNFINIFQKNFVSPISNFGLLYYKYYLVDSTNIGNKWCYNVMFKPRRKQEFAFTGNFWVTDTSYAIKKLEMRMAGDANINFINDMVISQEFEITGSGQWMLSREQTVADFNLVEDAKITMGFFGTRTVLYSDYDFSPVRDEKIYSMPNNVIVLDDANRKTDDFWKKTRPEALSHREASVYRLSDTLKKMPLFNTYVDVIKTLATGYYVKGNMEWGPYASTYSYNALEGNRFRVGGRTSNAFSTHTQLDGYLAYGTRDNGLKYHAGFMYMLGKTPDRVLSGSYKYDMEQLGMSENAFREDFILNSLFRRNPQDKLSMVSEYKGSYKHEWFTGFNNTIGINNRRIFTLGGSGINLYDPVTLDYVQRDHITTTELSFDLHYGYREKVLAGEFERTAVSSQYPVFNIHYAYGVKGLFNGEYEYHKLGFNATQWFSFLSAGYLKYTIEAGKTWGTLPFPLMNIYAGNETFYHDDYAFNLMNYYEFVSDEYATYHLIYHMEGFLLNRIPAIRKLKWREVAQLKGAVGHTSIDNKLYNQLPAGSYFISKPYMEAGIGIENIFRFIRVDAVWRLFYNDHPNIKPFGILVSMSFDF
ncbi:MAG: DUF5686 family protein [Bacteroidota bacterium]